jgi:glyoxylase I family protein
MSSATAPRPPVQGFHHFSATVSDVEASVDWYQRVLGLQRLPAPFPHYGSEKTGHAIVLMDADAGIAIGLHHHDGNDGQPFDETRTGLDHIAMSVPDRADLDAWAARLDSLGVPHNGVNDTHDPIPYSALVFRDPDNIQLEFFHLAS